MKSTIIFYTHNFLSRKLLESTISEAIKHAEANDCFLLVISHFPILNNFKDVSKLFDGTNDINLPEDLSKFCITDLKIDVSKDRAVNYVTGKLPYSYRSILNQLLFAFKQAKTENCILFEHDCFYPSNYYSAVEKNLKKHEMTFCKENYCMINRRGFYKCEPHIYLSSYSAKTETFLNVYNNKLNIYKDGNIKVFEPIVPHERIVKDINWTNDEKPNDLGWRYKLLKKVPKLVRPKTDKDVGVPIMLNLSSFKEEIITTNSVCLDNELDGCILEFQHGLNTSASLSTMRAIYDNGDLEPEYKFCLSVHPYWGDSKKFIDMLDLVEKTELTEKINAVGIHHCGL